MTDLSSSFAVMEFCGGNEVAKAGRTKPPRYLPGVRRSSGVRLAGSDELEVDIGSLGLTSPPPPPPDQLPGFLPVFRSGSCSDIGPKRSMEDEHVCVDNLFVDLSSPPAMAFYGVFDGHGGSDAARFVRENLLEFITKDPNFPTSVEKAMKCAFARLDAVLSGSAAAAGNLDGSSGTTALAALISGRTMHLANAGDCRAVLGRRGGKAVELTRDHKPTCVIERARIEQLGGAVTDDGYLNGQLGVSRALGDWHIKGDAAAKGFPCPLTGEPETEETVLMGEDEFVIMACDGLWDVMSSHCAVLTARRELAAHNDPWRCSRELVAEALRRGTCDNVTVVVVCFSPEPPPPPPRVGRVRRSISAEGLDLLRGVLDAN